jgi:hypothetical protein
VVNDFKTREIDARWVRSAAGLLFALIVVNAALMVRERPLTYVEGIKNIEARRQFEVEVPQALREELISYPGATILMDTSVFPNLVAFTGIPLRQTINESDLWIFDRALKAPAAHAQFVLAFDGDAVDQAVKAHPEGLVPVRHFTAHGQASGTLYRSFDLP